MTAHMTALGELFLVGSSKRVLKSQWQSEGVPFYRGREITRLAADGFVDNKLFISEEHFAELAKQYGVPKVGDIVITAIGTIGNSHVVRENDRFYFKDASVLWMKRTSAVCSAFVNLWLKSPQFFDQLDVGNGATVDTLTIQKLQSVQIRLPALSEQQRIVVILDEAFAGIATAKVNVEKNLQNARAVFESQLQSLFIQRGQGWVDKRLGDVLRTGAGGTPLKSKKEYYEGGTIPWLMSGEVSQGEVTVATKFITPKGLEISSARMFPKDTVLVAMYGATAGAVGILRFEASTNQAVCGILPSDKFLPEFLFYVLLSKKRELVDQATGNAQPNISQIKIKNTEIPVIAHAAQKEIVKKLDALREETQRLESLYHRKLDALDALKQSLLHQAFSGQL